MKSKDAKGGQPPVPWMVAGVERRRVDSLLPYARNARTHSQEQIEQIARSIQEWGWTTPILIDENGMIIAGHGRVLAAKRLGLREVPVMVAAGWTDAQKRAYVIADNQIAQNAGWDQDLLRFELAELADLNFDVTLTGFGPDESDQAKKIMGSAEAVQDAPLKLAFWISVEGPLDVQPEALAAFKTLAQIPGVTLQSNLREAE
jgi:hypothetical protein